MRIMGAILDVGGRRPPHRAAASNAGTIAMRTYRLISALVPFRLLVAPSPGTSKEP
jgi:hypothetical protein